MSNNLRDQLLGLGFKASSPKPAKKKPQRRAPAPKKQTREEMDLAKAYAIRAQTEKREVEEAKRLKEEQAALKRRQLAQLQAYLVGKGISTEGGDIARHFEYGAKIKRIYVTAEQLQLLHNGSLGVVQHKGSLHLLTREHVVEAAGIFAPSLALLVDPDAPVADDPYAKPEFQVPDDLIW